MNKKYFYIAAVFTLTAMFSGCSSVTDTGNVVEVESGMDSEDTMKELEKMSEIVESGKPAICLIKSTIEGQTTELSYWFKEGNIRMEGAFMPGQNMIYIERDNTSYMEPQAMFGQSDTDCDWVSMEDEDDETDEYEMEDEEDMDFDFEQFEDNMDYEVVCRYESFGDDVFETSGKVCSMEEYMGIDLDTFESLDLGEF